MNKGVKYFFAFLLGAAAGAASSWRFFKTKYEEIADEEIRSVKEVFLKRYAGNKSEDNSEIEDEEATLEDYSSVLTKNNYASSFEAKKNNEKAVVIMPKKYDGPYVITPEEFGEEDDYDTISLTYYADKVLTNDQDEVINDVDDVVGSDSLNHFGEYEDDSVFVRNDLMKTDYEILLDIRKYSDVINEYDHPLED